MVALQHVIFNVCDYDDYTYILLLTTIVDSVKSATIRSLMFRIKKFIATRDLIQIRIMILPPVLYSHLKSNISPYYIKGQCALS